MPSVSAPCFPCSRSFPEGICCDRLALTVTLSPGRCAWQHLSTTWRGPLPSRPARTRCAASAWRWCMRNPQPQRGGLGSCPTAPTPTACPASASGDVPSSLRTPSSSEFWVLPWPGRGWSCSQGSCRLTELSKAAPGCTGCPLVPLPEFHSPAWDVWPWKCRGAAQPSLTLWSVGRVDSGPAGTLQSSVPCTDLCAKPRTPFSPLYVLSGGIFS